jgi:4-amino-4-deoxy-L-arabinose transferase-like glycosyltransferase
MAQLESIAAWHGHEVRARARLHPFSAAFAPATIVVTIIVIGAILRLALAASFGLGTDESYTVANARHFALSYVDYPPLHVWLVGAWTRLLSSELPVVARLPFIAAFAATTWIMFRLTALLFGERAGLWAAILLNLAPVFTLAHASWVLPDGPLCLFLLLSAYALARVLFADGAETATSRWWLAAGAFAGLAMLSKYHGLFVPGACLLFLLTSRAHRAWLRSPWPWLAAGLALVLFFPVIVWNSAHDWVALSFQAKRLDAAHHISLTRPLLSVAAQAGYLSPWLFAPMAAAWIAALRRGPASPKTWFLALLAAGPIALFTAATIVAPGLPHWPMPGWLFVFPLAGAWTADFAWRWPRLARTAAFASATLLAAAGLALGLNARTGWLTENLSANAAQSDPTLDVIDWTEVREALAARHLDRGEIAAVAATHWMEAGKLNYAVGRTMPVLCLCPDPQEFRYLSEPQTFAGKTLLVIGAHRDLRAPEASLGRWFTGVRTLAPIVLHRGGRPALTLTVIQGIGFSPAPLNRS